jgi:hypothetical protein
LPEPTTSRVSEAEVHATEVWAEKARACTTEVWADGAEVSKVRIDGIATVPQEVCTTRVRTNPTLIGIGS